MTFPRLLLSAVFVALFAPAVLAQGMQLSFGDLKQDPSSQVEISADQLKVDQTDGSAVFTGNVIIGQGEMRLAANHVRVEYGDPDGPNAGKIARLLAKGDVTLTNGEAAAQAREAEYTINTGSIIMIGDVIVTQGTSAASANRMVVDLKTGTAVMTGRVKTIIQTGGN